MTYTRKSVISELTQNLEAVKTEEYRRVYENIQNGYYGSYVGDTDSTSKWSSTDLSRNDKRFIEKLRHTQNRNNDKNLSDNAYFDYLTAKPKAQAKIKKMPKSTSYVPTEIKKVEKEYNPSYKSTRKYRVNGFEFYHKSVILDLTDVEYEHLDRFNRQIEERENGFIHLVFRYEPLTRTGKPNPYDGITQLREFLKTQKVVTESKPDTLKSALNALVGSEIEMPEMLNYNYTSKSDLLTVYTVYGDFETFDRELSVQ